MLCGIYFVSCLTLGLVNSYPLVFDYYNPNVRDVEDTEYRDFTQSFKQSPCLRSHSGDVKCFFYRPENIPELPDYSTFPDPTEIAARLNQDPITYEPEPNGNLENPATELLNNPNYNVYNYESSPIRTYIHGLVPQDSDYYGDIYPSEDPLNFNRLARRTTSYEEFLAQLSHDAQMNNILPTMPFVRTAGPQYYVPYGPYGPYGGGSMPVQAAFPQAAGGCARPLLFGCSPTIYRGVIAHRGYPDSPAVHVLTPSSYKDSLNPKEIRNKANPPVDAKKKYDLEVSKDKVPDYFISN